MYILSSLSQYYWAPDVKAISTFISIIIIIAAILIPIIIIYSIWKIHREINIVGIAILQQNELIEELIKELKIERKKENKEKKE